jgi:hypothetical protein
VNLQIDAVGAEIAKVGNKLEAIDGQLEQLKRGRVVDVALQEWLDSAIDLQDLPDPLAARRAAVNALISDLNKDKDRLAQKEHDLREKEKSLSAEKAVLLGKLPGDGNVTAGVASTLFLFLSSALPSNSWRPDSCLAVSACRFDSDRGSIGQGCVAEKRRARHDTFSEATPH